MIQRRTSVLLLIVFASMSVTAATIVTLPLGPVQVDKPVEGDPLTTQSWKYPLYPGEKTYDNFSITNDNSTVNYSVKFVLESYTGPDGNYTDRSEIAHSLANEDEGPYIHHFGVNGTGGFEGDLLNDGVAYYQPLPTNTTRNASIGLTATESVQTYGNVNLTLSVYRANNTRKANTVQIHQSRNNTCDSGDCHDSNKSMAVHTNMSAGDDCIACHGRSMEDLHMSCTAGCHDDFPIPINDSSAYDHGPDTYMEDTGIGSGYGSMENNYFCGANCHGSQISSSHTYRLGDRDYCAQCHTASENATIRSFHDQLSQDCPACHGKNSERIHSHYEIEPNNQCKRCHDTQLG